jgi:transcription-repair coupling factor (superfamily II helicase)
MVSVDLPLPVGLPVDYIPDQNLRLRLYRRVADLRSLTEVDAIALEFSDRFGPPPESVRNLFYQVKIKLLAEEAGLASVGGEGAQIVLHYPPLPEGMSYRSLPHLGLEARTGKNAIWLPAANPDWPDKLLSILMILAGRA